MVTAEGLVESLRRVAVFLVVVRPDRLHERSEQQVAGLLMNADGIRRRNLSHSSAVDASPVWVRGL